MAMYIGFKLDEAGKVAAILRFCRAAVYLSNWHHSDERPNDGMAQFYQSNRGFISIGLTFVVNEMVKKGLDDAGVEVFP